MPSAYACPGVDRNVIADACVAMIESATVPQRISRPARRYPWVSRLRPPFQMPYPTMAASAAASTAQSSWLTRTPS